MQDSGSCGLQLSPTHDGGCCDSAFGDLVPKQEPFFAFGPFRYVSQRPAHLLGSRHGTRRDEKPEPKKKKKKIEPAVPGVGAMEGGGLDGL